MLTKLLPEQISKFWDIIRFAVEQSLPPIVGDHPDKMNRILSSALSSKVDVWASYVRSGESTRFEGIVLTKFLYDDASDTKNLLIYCIYGYNSVDRSSWMSGLEAIVKYAKTKRCSQIIAYTDLPGVVDLAKHLGADTKYTFLSFGVDKIIKNLNELSRR